MTVKLPVSVVVVTKNAAPTLAATLQSLSDFDEIVLVDSNSADETAAIAQRHNVPVTPFEWNGQYPKKRQWCLDHLTLRHDWVFFVDGDEIITPELADEIRAEITAPKAEAYFVRGQPVFCGHALRHGRWNNKIVLFRRDALAYPVIPDLDAPGMGEIEGHYQSAVNGRTGQLQQALIHDCAETLDRWIDRHQRYAAWQALMEYRGVDLAVTESGLRGRAKRAFQDSFGRAVVAFLDSYILNKGFLDGAPGLHYAVARGWYYWLISARKFVLAQSAKTNGSARR